MKEFEDVKGLVDYMITMPNYEGGAILQGEYIELRVDSPEVEGFTWRDYDGGPNMLMCYTKNGKSYNAIIPTSMEYDLKEAVSQYEK